MAEPALILTEDLVGLRNQALGLAERAGLSPLPCAVRPRGPFAQLPARFWPTPLAMASLPANLPRLAIGCGGKSAPLVAALRTPARLAVQVQNPRLDPRRFDLVITQAHDLLTGPNILVTRTALHRASPAALDQARTLWAPRFADLPRPLIGVLIGGGNGRYRLDPATASQLGAALAGLIGPGTAGPGTAGPGTAGPGLALTPSRRTAPRALAALAAHLAPRGAWLWDGTGDNPYLGLLALADALLVTCDSVSMLSEAAATAAPLLILDLPGRSRRIDAFGQSLIALGRARPFTGRLERWDVAPLDDTPLAAEALHGLLGARCGT